ncbi:hypothetical protein RQP46_004588 [Phenoliferia psychrophenolica]
MAISPLLSVKPLPYPATCSPSLAEDGFGVVVEGVQDINNLTPEEFQQIEHLLYPHGVVLFPNVDLTPKGQFQLTNAFDPESVEYGHGAVGRPEAKSILHPDLRNIPSQPAVQLIGNGPISEAHITQGLPTPVQLKHPSHQSFHKSTISDEDSAAGFTRFYRWHIDAALYERDPPKVTTLYGLKMPVGGPKQTVRYDDGTGDELEASLGATAFVSGAKMFELLPAPLKSVAVRTRVQYSKSNSTGLGMVSEGLETTRADLPPFEEAKIKTYPMLWKNPLTGALHFQVHPSGIESLHIDPVPAGTPITKDTLYPDGVHLTDLEAARALVYSMQRPAISPEYVYAHEWKPKDLALFHNRGVLHSITGAFKPDEQRAFWQCNLASTDQPVGPSAEDIAKFV